MIPDDERSCLGKLTNSEVVSSIKLYAAIESLLLESVSDEFMRRGNRNDV